MEQPSTRNLGALPCRDDLIRITKSIAILDAILCPEWERRYYSFNARWDDSEMLASMRNGCGDDWKAHITGDGIIIFGLAHESTTCRPDDPWPGLLDNVPSVFDNSVAEPAFETSNLSFCVWLLVSSATWAKGNVALPDVPDPDGSEDLLKILDGNPETYVSWAQSYYEKPVEIKIVRAIYNGASLTDEMVRSLNPDVGLKDLHNDVEEIGYSGRAV